LFYIIIPYKCDEIKNIANIFGSGYRKYFVAIIYELTVSFSPNFLTRKLGVSIIWICKENLAQEVRYE